LPTYEYKCKVCGKTFELKQHMRDKAITDCLMCQAKNSVDRIIFASGISFKGSGFYVNDYVTPDINKIEGEKT